MNIFICEDNQEQRLKLEKIIQDILLQDNIQGNINISTSSSEDILTYIKEHNSTGVYFLDIDIGENINGIELAKKINKVDRNANIIMITSHAEMSPLTFKYHIGAIDYIVKGREEEIYKRVRDCLKFIDDKNKQYTLSNCITIENNQSVEKTKYDDIIFFETTKKRTIAVHTYESYVEFKGTLNEIEKKLDKRFIRCHKSFIVNKDKVVKVDKRQRILFMEDGSKCFVSMLLMNKVISKILSNK